MTVVKRQEPINGQLCTEIVVFPRKHLFPHTSPNLSLEIEDSTETQISPFTTLVVL